MACNQRGSSYTTSQPLVDRFIGWESIILFSFVCVAVHICAPTPENVCPYVCACADQRVMTGVYLTLEAGSSLSMELEDSARLAGQ